MIRSDPETNSKMATKTEISPLSRKQFQLFVTETCNYNCDGCPYPLLSRERQATLRNQEFDPRQWKIVTDYLYDQGVRLFCLIGGEPCSYEEIAEVIGNISHHPDALVILSTSGLHLRRNADLRKRVAKELIGSDNRRLKNAIAISFDVLPSGEKPRDSREHKAREGVALIKDLRAEYGDRICYTANVMVCPENIDDVLEMQSYLQDRGIYTNLCIQQTKCFGEEPIFDYENFPSLKEVALKMINRKLGGGLVVNSVNYLIQFTGVIGLEKYECWNENDGSPVIDIGPNGQVRFCNWIGQNSSDGPPGIDINQLMSGELSWQEFFHQSKEVTSQLCGGCSWSRRDRNIEPMIKIRLSGHQDENLLTLNPSFLKSQNIWTQAQLFYRS